MKKSQTQHAHLPAIEAPGGDHAEVEMNSGDNRKVMGMGRRGWITGTNVYLRKGILCFRARQGNCNLIHKSRPCGF